MSKIDTLVVCGDSFQDTGLVGHEGTHWSEIVSSRLNLNLMNLAISGGSSVAVAFQMLYAENIPNCLVVGSMAASEMRYELSSQTDAIEKLNYRHFAFKSTKNPLNAKRDPFIQLIRSMPVSMMEEGLQSQILTNFNFNIKRQTDLWSILYALRTLHHKKIPVLFFQALPNGGPIPMEDFAPFVDESCIIKAEELDIYSGFFDHSKMSLREMEELDPGYHTTHERQVEIADYMTVRIKNLIDGHTQ